MRAASEPLGHHLKRPFDSCFVASLRLGQARARAQGKEIGRPREVANDVEQRIHGLRADRYGYKAISQTTGVPRSTVRRVLKGAKKHAGNSVCKSRSISSRRSRFVGCQKLVPTENN